METYLNLNNVWTPVLAVPVGTAITDGIIAVGDTRYSVTFLKSSSTTDTYIIRSKTRVELPEAAKQTALDLTAQIVNLQAQIAQMQLNK